MAEIRRSRLETLKTRASRTFYFLMGAAVGAAGVWAAVNVSDSAADALNLAPESDLVGAHLLIDDLEEDLSAVTNEIRRFLELQRVRKGLDDLETALFQDLLDRQNERAAAAP